MTTSEQKTSTKRLESQVWLSTISTRPMLPRDALSGRFLVMDRPRCAPRKFVSSCLAIYCFQSQNSKVEAVAITMPQILDKPWGSGGLIEFIFNQNFTTMHGGIFGDNLLRRSSIEVRLFLNFFVICGKRAWTATRTLQNRSFYSRCVQNNIVQNNIASVCITSVLLQPILTQTRPPPTENNSLPRKRTAVPRGVSG